MIIQQQHCVFMTEQHFRHVIDKYNLMKFSCTNDMFRPKTLGNLDFRMMNYKGYAIYNDHYMLFVWLPSEQLAREIIQHIKDTEVLFQ